MFKNCNKKAINSHGISEEASLKLIADEDGHLISLKSQRSGMDWKMEFIPVSTGDASTFTGFCHEHDQFFNRLDSGKFETYFDVINQCFRSMSHTLYNYEYYFKVYKQERDNLDDFINLQSDIYKSLGLTREEFKNRFIEENDKLWNKRFEDYERINEFKCELNDLLEMSEEIKHLELFNGKIIEYNWINSHITYRRIPIKIPVALINHLSAGLNGKVSDLQFTIVPDKESTHFIQFNYRNSRYFTNDFLDKTKNSISALNYIEQIMMLNEKNWFIDPKVVDKFSNEKKLMIEQDMYFMHERSLNDKYDISIFDSIRIDLITELKGEEKEKELKKINELPYRKSFQTRKHSNDKILEGIWLRQ